MVKGSLPLEVPNLTSHEVKLVELHSFNSLEEIDYQTGKHLTRDELFLENFGTPVTSLHNGIRNNLNVTAQCFHTLSIVAGFNINIKYPMALT
jgi:hypothetical protein